MILPEIYVDFCKRCKRSMPANLVGTDLAGVDDGLYDAAVELLEENNVDNFLTDEDFVFLMHQGYVFAYFRADGQPDPDVYIFSEPGKKRENKGSLSRFLDAYSNEA